MNFSISGLHIMAGSSRIIVATLLPLLVHFTTCSDHTTHYVKPNANTPCPADPCVYTRKCILNVAENSSDNFTGKDSGGYNSFTLVFMDNSALIHGGAVYTKNSILSYEGRNTFSGNSTQYYGGGIYSENSTLKFSGDTSFCSNSGLVQGGGIYGLAASIYFRGNNSFTANSAARGGGEYLDSNNAAVYGGAV